MFHQFYNVTQDLNARNDAQHKEPKGQVYVFHPCLLFAVQAASFVPLKASAAASCMSS